MLYDLRNFQQPGAFHLLLEESTPSRLHCTFGFLLESLGGGLTLLLCCCCDGGSVLLGASLLYLVQEDFGLDQELAHLVQLFAAGGGKDLNLLLHLGCHGVVAIGSIWSPGY